MATMAKGSKPLWGSSKDAYFRRMLRAESSVDAETFERLMGRVQAEVVQVRLREVPDAEVRSSATGFVEPVAEPELSGDAASTIDESERGCLEAIGEGAPFDPYSPNVIVVIRTAGRDQALAALSGIERVDHLRVLAREQQLSLEGELLTATEIRAAIVVAAERRIANRKAAAG